MEAAGFGKPYWWEAAPPPEPDSTPVGLPAAVDAVVVGAGFTGLAAARTLARAGRTVLVLDRQPLGFGASTRNGGMAGSGTRQNLTQLTARFGPGPAREILQESLQAVDSLEQTIRALHIDCDFVRSGRVLTAWRRSDLDTFARQADDINAIRPDEAELISAERLRHEEVASARYHGGLVLRTHGSLHPAKLHAGLLAAARAAGAAVAGRTPVHEIRRERGCLRVQSALGSVQAAHIIVATNGYTGGAFPWLARRLLPIPSYILASHPLPPEHLSQILPGNRMIVETRGRHGYYRRSPDGTRLLFGGRASLTRITPARAAPALRRMIAGLFPEASRNLRYSHCWTGWVAFSGTYLPFIARRDGVHYVGGYNGNGVALSVYLGRKAALEILGEPEGDTVFARCPPTAPAAWQLPGGLLRATAELALRGRDLADAAARPPAVRKGGAAGG